jgi:hypothetical protein
MPTSQPTLSLVLKAISLAMAVATVVLQILGTTGVETGILLLGLGLFALALDALRTA